MMLKKAAQDLYQGLLKWRIWTHLARNDLITRYRRSWLGAGWVLISFTAFVVAKILVFGTISTKNLAFFSTYVASGYMIFKFLSAVVVDGANSLTAAEGWIKGENLPLSIYVYRSILRNAIVASYTLPPVILICLYSQTYTLSLLFSIVPVMLIYFVNAVWISVFLGIICARYRDISHLIIMGMSLLYFLTPVLWVKPDTGTLALIATYNPLTYYIDILRAPMFENSIPVFSWYVVGAMTLFGIVLMMTSLGHLRQKLIYWL